jgi:ABC-type glycerol-3-phosphate transport system substrate-binding protein
MTAPSLTTTTRRTLITGAAAAGLPLVHIRSGRAAGKLALAFWDHWVPGGNDAMTAQINTWAAANHVDVTTDYMSTGNKLPITAAAEHQARTGHDAIALPVWEIHNHAEAFEPVDAVMQRLIGKYGPTNEVNEYLAKIDGHWLAVPSNSGSQNQPPCGRISVLKDKAGLDVLAMYPVNTEYTSGAEAWTWDAHLKAAEACHNAHMPFALGLSNAGDCVDFCGALFAAYGAELVDAKGGLALRSDAMRQVLEYGERLVKVLPPDVLSYDSASNNRALISGHSALIFNPPSAWAVAKRDQPQIARDCWTFPAPRGPKGRFIAYNPYFWGVWSFSRNKTAAMELLEYLSERPQVEERTRKVEGFDIPPFDSMLNFKVWEEVEPPRGTVYHYPLRPFHHAHPHVAGAPAPASVAVQIYNRGTQPAMLARLFNGQSIPQVLDWAEEELGGFTR